jgi:hypothetical protein
VTNPTGTRIRATAAVLGLATWLLSAAVTADEELAPPPEFEPPATDCADGPRLERVHELDFGSLRIPAGEAGYVSVAANGSFGHSGNLLVIRDPTPGELKLCGAPDQEIALLIDQPTQTMHLSNVTPVARRAAEFTIRADNMNLERVDTGRWEGRLGAAGTTRLRVGATLYLEPGGAHGTPTADLSIDVIAR